MCLSVTLYLCLCVLLCVHVCAGVCACVCVAVDVHLNIGVSVHVFSLKDVVRMTSLFGFLVAMHVLYLHHLLAPF